MTNIENLQNITGELCVAVGKMLDNITDKLTEKDIMQLKNISKILLGTNEDVEKLIKNNEVNIEVSDDCCVDLSDIDAKEIEDIVINNALENNDYFWDKKSTTVW